MTDNVTSFPRELAQRSSPNVWRSVGDAAGHVLSGVAYRCAVQSSAYPILRQEGSEVGIIPSAAPAE